MSSKPRIEELMLQRQSNIIRAPRRARVVSLTASEGHFAVRGEPILVLADLATREVQLWIPEAAQPNVQLGYKFLVARAHEVRPQTTFLCAVSSLSPRVEEIPQRLWRDARIAEFGRAVLLSATQTLPLLHGERVRIDTSEEAAEVQ